jgi:hypothetical protein
MAFASIHRVALRVLATIDQHDTEFISLQATLTCLEHFTIASKH